MARQIAIVEDEPSIRANYAEALGRYGYEVKTFPNRPEASAAFALRLPDLVMIDIGLADEPEGGFELCRELRARSQSLPIIFLTARDSDFDIISGLRLGADDYLTKDISLQHLLARIVSLFRRAEALSLPPGKDALLEHGPLALDSERMMATWNTKPVALTVKFSVTPAAVVFGMSTPTTKLKLLPPATVTGLVASGVVPSLS